MNEVGKSEPVPDMGQGISGKLCFAGIGASLYDLDALQELAANLPNSKTITYIVALQSAAGEAGVRSNAWARNASLEMKPIEDGEAPKGGTIYLAPPDRDVVLEGGVLRLVDPLEPAQAAPSVNRLFDSLASEKQGQAIGVILSGKGTDGALGLQAIRAAGGITVVQEPDTAKFCDTPNAAIRSGEIDLIMQLSEISEFLERLASEGSPAAVLADDADELQSDALNQITALVRQKTGFRLSDYKPSTIRRRIVRRMKNLDIASHGEYLARLRDSDDEASALVRDSFISVTSFFRDADAFRALKRVIDDLVEGHEDDGVLRCWVPGCATGEEAYSIAMLFEDALVSFGKTQLTYVVFATDLDSHALNAGRSCAYPAEHFDDVPRELKSKYVTFKSGRGEISRAIRQKVIFSFHNVIDNPPFAHVDLISCRNLMIYLNASAQQRLMQIFHFALKPGRHLFLGAAESADAYAELFAPVDGNHCIYRRLDGSRTSGLPLVARLADQAQHGILEKKPGASRSDPVRQRMLELIAEKFGPPSVLVDKRDKAVSFQGDLKSILTLPTGAADWDLFKLIDPARRAELRALLNRCRRDRQPLEGGIWRLDSGSGTVAVKPVVSLAGPDLEGYLLVSFQILDRDAANDTERSQTAANESILRELERELSDTRNLLDIVTEELEKVHQEFSALNEELQASNEELYASNEELNFSNEELKSTNEELLSANDELSVKSEELKRLNERLGEEKRALEEANVEISRRMEESRLLGEASAHGVVAVDPDGVITFVNTATCELFGYTKDELIGKPVEILVPAKLRSVHVEHRQDESLTQKVIYKTGKGKLLHGLDKAGNEIPVDIQLRRSLSEHAPGVVASIADLRPHMEVERELREAKDAADAANAAKSQFLATMSHEIRTPLHVIVGMLQLLARSVADPQQKNFVEKAQLASNLLRQIIDDILDFSKIEAGRLVLEEADFDLNDVLDTLAAQFSSAMAEKDLEILFDTDSGLPVSLRGDSLRLQQILLNLLSNAVKFTNEGTVTVCARTLERSENRAKLEFSVADTGIGIPEDKLEEIFDGFAQAHASTSRRFGGTGLGLAISRRLVELMGGKLEVTSEVGVGSRFSFAVELPLAEPAGKASAQAAVPAEGELRVLIVDDHEDARLMLSAMAADLGWHVDIAASGRDAIARLPEAAARQAKFDVVLIDWKMPGLDGWETARQMRSLERSVIPDLFVLVTAHDLETLRQHHEAEDRPFDHFLSKPVTRAALRQLETIARREISAGQAKGPASAEDMILAGKRILLAEDFELNQELMRSLLEPLGAELAIASNGTEAIKLASEADPPFDIVLMDVRMPELDGLEATRALRSEYGLVDLPIIGLTANAMPSDRDEALAAGMNDYVSKPIDLDHLVAVIRRLAR